MGRFDKKIPRAYHITDKPQFTQTCWFVVLPVLALAAAYRLPEAPMVLWGDRIATRVVAAMELRVSTQSAASP
jgi:hypothetical protein